MKTLRTLFEHARARFLGAVLLGALSGASFALVLALANRAIAQVGAATAASVLGFLAACAAAFATSAWSQVILVRLAQDIVLDLQKRLVLGILASPLRDLERIGEARLMSVVTADVEAVSRAAPWVARVLVNAAILAACLLYLAWLSAPLTGMLCLFLVFGGLSYSRLTARGVRFIRASQRARDALYGHFRSLVQGTKELKLHRRWRRRFGRLFLDDADRFRRERIHGTSLFAVTGAWAVTLFFLAVGFVIFAAPAILSLSSILLPQFALCILFMLTPLRSIMNGVPEVAQAEVALDRVAELGLVLSPRGSAIEEQGDSAGTAHADLDGSAGAAAPPATIELRGVTFQFDGEAGEAGFALGPLDLTIHRGEVLFIVGGNGSGKSTLAKLLTGLYPCAAGEIRVDGRRVDGGTLEPYRSLFSAVFADYHLFDELLGGDGPAFAAEASRYLRRLDLGHKVQLQGHRLSSTALSQGQRKRLALLAAVLEDRPICVFDEWAADQDPAFKDVFYREILPELKARGKTVVAITHDERYFGCADRCVQLDSGRLAHERVITP